MQRKNILRAVKRVALLPGRETPVPTGTYLQLTGDEAAVYAEGVDGLPEGIRAYGKWEPGFFGVVEVTMLNTGREAVFVEKWQELGHIVKMTKSAGDRA